MYFPYVRGRQYELLALRELAENNLLGEYIIPVVEPVKLSPTLVNMMDVFVKMNQPLAIIRNPSVGTFISEWQGVQKDTREAGYKKRFSDQFANSNIIKSIIMQDDSVEYISSLEKQGFKKSDLLVIHTNRNYLNSYLQEFNAEEPRYVLIPDKREFKRKIHNNKVILEDKFEKLKRNKDYKEADEDFFSDDHLFYEEEGYVGFADYSVVGNDYFEKGFAPYAVAIHIVYFDSDNNLHVKHFVSDSNEDISNPAKKFYEAVSKVAKWVKDGFYNDNDMTTGLNSFLDFHKNQSYPGLGTVKKLSLMHHLELVGRFMEGKK